jgi:hypothetical protein
MDRREWTNRVNDNAVGPDLVSGTTAHRSMWGQLMGSVRLRDMVIRTELPRLSRLLAHGLEVVRTGKAHGIARVSWREHLDAGSVTGRCVLAMTGALAQMARELKAGWTVIGRAAAKTRGRTGGPSRLEPETLEHGRMLSPSSQKTAVSVCHTVRMARRPLSGDPIRIRTRAKTASSQSVNTRAVREDHVRGVDPFRPARQHVRRLVPRGRGHGQWPRAAGRPAAPRPR